MNSVRRIVGSAATGANPFRAPADSQDHSQHAPNGRALVPVAPTPPPHSERSDSTRAAAPFLAQLIAAKQNLPQARERRRAEPREAIAAYVAAARAA